MRKNRALCSPVDRPDLLMLSLTAMAAEKPGAAGPTVFVRHGGTSTGAEDRRGQQYRVDVAKRRSHSDKKNQVLRASARGDSSVGLAREFSRRMASHNEHMVVVLKLVRRDNSIQEHMVCELLQVPTLDHSRTELSLQMVCPKCVFNFGRGVDESQINIRQSNRMFNLVPASEGEIWVNPNNPSEVYTLAGNIETDDWITCPAQGCGFRFKIGSRRGEHNCIVADWL